MNNLFQQLFHIDANADFGDSSIAHTPFFGYNLTSMQKTNKNPVIGIIGGRGVLGTVFRREFAKIGIPVLISGRHPKGDVLSNTELIQRSDIVIVSVPLADTTGVIYDIASLMRKDQLLADFTSLKVEAVDLMLTSKAEVVGLHPMFGEVASLTGLAMIACPVRAKRWWPWLRATLERLKLVIHETTPAKHDELAAVHQAIPHLLSVAYGAFLTRRGLSPQKIFEVASPSTRLSLLTTGRLLACDPALYRDIQLKNPAAARATDEIGAIIGEMAGRTRGDTFFREFTNAAKHFGPWKDQAFAETNRLFDTLNRHQLASPKRFKQERQPSRATLAILGPGTNTELAMRTFVERAKLPGDTMFCRTITAVFQAVARGKVEIGFIPLENYSVGPVRETVKALEDAGGKIRIIAEISQPITHALLAAHTTNRNSIVRIYAHPQARAQCQHFLQKNFPHAEVIETPNTGEAIATAQADNCAAAIGPAEMADQSITVLRKSIADDPNNRTRFIAIAMQNSSAKADKIQNSKLAKTAIAFSFTSDRPGQLAAALTFFAEAGINLSRIESIPGAKKGYFFFTECTASNADPALQNVLKRLSTIANVINLGSYTEI